ncbi:hypothetical protein L195_g062920, partial [Trifolium pratense]
MNGVGIPVYVFGVDVDAVGRGEASVVILLGVLSFPVFLLPDAEG